MSKINHVTPEEQQRLLSNSMSIIKTEIHQMRKCLETKHKFMDSLKHASNFLNELRTSSLNPKQYYELYIMVHDGLTYLANYLKDNKSSSNNYLIDLYELVQYAGNIIPRLYLMITIGSVYMESEDAPVNEILNDMLEMCKGVQNPIRGLFLRYYLIQKTKYFIIKYAGPENLDKMISYIITNFIEMNKLWVRQQHQGHSSERARRIEERNELKILVGSNLVILSQLDSINVDIYKEKILPEILQQIIKCNDSIAQNYLLDVIIQIFPDNFQIASLNLFLESLLKVNTNVNITMLINSLIERLLHYKLRNQEVLKDSSFLNEFILFIEKLNGKYPNFNINDYCLILNNVLKLSLTFQNEDVLSYMDSIYKSSIDKFNSMKDNEDSSIDDFKIILKSIEHLGDFNDFFKINDESYFNLFKLQKPNIQNEICVNILDILVDNEIKISNRQDLEKIFKYIRISILSYKKYVPAITDTKKDLFGEPSSTEEDPTNYEPLCRFLHFIDNESIEEKYSLLEECEKYLLEGNPEKTISTLVSIQISLIRKMDIEKLGKKELSKKFNKLSQSISFLKEYNPLKAFNLYLYCATTSNLCKLNNISYELFIEAFIVYEEYVVDSKTQMHCLTNIINKLITMDQMIIFDAEEFDKLITKTALYGSRLMKKTDQCRAIYNSSHLWWIIKEEPEKEEEDEEVDAEDFEETQSGKRKHVEDTGINNSDDEEPSLQVTLKRDDKRVLECLQKSLRIADSIMDSNASIELFVEILNQSIYYFIHGNEMINVRYLNGLIELIGNNFKEVNSLGKASLEDGPYKKTWGHYQRTLKYIKEQRAVDGRFHEIAI